MQLPFSENQFLDVFGAYNTALWPAVAAFWIATLAFTVELARGRSHPMAFSLLAAMQWAWSGVAYHALFFSRINPAAWLFAVLFVAQAVAFVWYGVLRHRLTFDWSGTLPRVLAGAFLVYSLLYPVVVLLSGRTLPRAPAFAVPCPTALYTAGVLLAAAPPVPRWLFVVPVAWSFIGGSAALLLGMTPDLMLFVAGACMALYGLANRNIRQG